MTLAQKFIAISPPQISMGGSKCTFELVANEVAAGETYPDDVVQQKLMNEYL
jgi:hypothetical protein